MTTEATREGRRIDYQVTGEGQPLVLVPGLGSGAKLFGTLPRRFAREGFGCVTFNPVGVTPSSAHQGEYDLDVAARDLLAVLDAAEIESCDLVGTSLGGKVALCAAALAPERVRRLVMLASAAVSTPRARRIYRFFEILSERLLPEELGEVLATFLFGHSFQARHEQVVADIVRSMKLDDTTRRLMVAQARCLLAFDGSDRARALVPPCLCIAGLEDTLTLRDEIAATAELMPNATLEEIAGAGHSLLLESARVFDLVREFLSD